MRKETETGEKEKEKEKKNGFFISPVTEQNLHYDPPPPNKK